MRIELLYTPDCPDYVQAAALIQEVLAETGIPASVELLPLETEEQARRHRFIGSPTVRIEGLDVEPYVTFAATDFRLGCRTYVERGEVRGWPSRRQLKDAIEVGWLVEQGFVSTCC